MHRFILTISIFVFSYMYSFGQSYRWQQAVKYEMDIDFNIKKHLITGTQYLDYTNNSPDTLDKVFYHLYFNAFKPNSMMDVRSSSIVDPDPRVRDRIGKLITREQGYQKIKSLKLNGKNVAFRQMETILEVTLKEPVLPNTTVRFEMTFEAQIPIQIRRSGRFNKEGIEYSFSQWYPKMCNYDEQGWHAHPYVGREFYGIWGNFDVRITLPSNYVVAGTGILQNKEEVGYGYSTSDPTERPKTHTWHFKAENVHDFVWAADPDYRQIVHTCTDGTIIRCFFEPGDKTTENWEKLAPIMEEAFAYLNPRYGQYPYAEYAFIQGGDGGMEYPMATLITGERSLLSLVGVSVHELVHSWYQGVLATNESLYHWMDEGFTNYVSAEVMNHLKTVGMIPGETQENPHLQTIRGFVNFTQSGNEEPMILHADHFLTNTAYNVASYTKGEVFLEQLRYIIGTESFNRGMKRYFDTWKFRHPNPNDFIRIMEKESGIELDWFKEYFVHTTHTIDYSIDEVKGSKVIFGKKGIMPMPVDFVLKLKNGDVMRGTIPLVMMRGVKKNDALFADNRELKPWPWTHPTYTLELEVDTGEIEYIEIDPTQRMADINRSNNVYPWLLDHIREGKNK